MILIQPNNLLINSIIKNILAKPFVRTFYSTKFKRFIEILLLLFGKGRLEEGMLGKNVFHPRCLIAN
jgi:hypothetical protein